MDYEKKYKEALGFVEKVYRYSNDPDEKRRIEEIFPELKESEDEKIMQEIIDFLELPHPQFVGKRDHEKWIAWLEKQGEQKKKQYQIYESTKDRFYKEGVKDGILIGIKKQNSAWSEEDEKMFKRCVKTMKDAYYLDGEALYWLETRFMPLIPQNTWKPSGEQIQALESATKNCAYSEYQDCLRELIEQLKKLKG